MKLKQILTDARKAVGVAVATVPAAVAAGYIDNAQAATLTGAFGVAATALTYLLKNADPKPAPLLKDE